ncbi:MAG: Mfa1 fimbrilin C-terminal domain-containing protein, partial [Muribaculaceae bacterium]|nr:Mfa1 fimbrilin C-terminal domain-containing protein [Muribaculaceae bacterium]
YGKAMMVPDNKEDGTPYERPSTSKEAKTFTKTEMNADEAVEWTDEGAFYPRENTFPVEFMKYANTTRIGFWVTFTFKDKDGNELNLGETKDFFTKGLDKSTIYVRTPKGLDPLTALVIADLNNNDKVKKAIEDAIDKDNNPTYTYDLADILDITLDQTKLAKSGEIVIASIAFKSKDVLNKMNDYEDLFKATPTLAGSGYDFNNKGELERLNNLDQVFVYQGGKTFYEVRIKHFGDDLTPWTARETASTIDQSYGPADDETKFRTRNNKYLGRYGIVRNNWYDLQIDKITKLGDPQDPAKWDGSWPGKPDDNKDEYIAVILRVLSWAKRTQSVTF